MKHPSSIAQAAPRIEAGDLQPRQLVEASLDRIDRFDRQIRAWVVVDADGALSAADALGEEAKAGNYRGPLHGIPIGIKDIVDVAGMPTRAGSTVTDPAPVACDAPVVAHLRAAGAIVLGKTVTTEFAFIDPAPTRNPWNLRHTPGGSSSGSAAAVAAEMCFAAIGSQTGGSITRPASYCGVAGFKPTFNSVDRTGVVAVSEHLDHVGPIARTIGDLAVMFAAMTGRSEAVDRGAMLEQSAPPRLGLVETYFLEESDEAVRSGTFSAIKILDTAEATIVTRELPDSFSDVHAMHRRIMAVEAAEVHQARLVEHRDQYGCEILALVDEGAATNRDAYQTALVHQRRFRDEMTAALADVDALVAPATMTTAPASLASTGDPSFNSPWSYAGLPTVSVPCGLAADGMPLSLQLIGPAGADARLLAVGAWCEAVVGFDRSPPLAS